MAAMSSSGRRTAAISLAATLCLTLGLSGCGGETKKPKAKPTTTAGVTLTPSGSELKLGEGANLKWSPNQKVTGLVDVAVTKIVQGSAKDIAKVVIKPRPAGMRLYYVSVHLKNVGKTNLGGISPNKLPLHLDEGRPEVQPPAILDPRLKFANCPNTLLPAKFGKGAEADLCLVYVATSPIKRMLLQPAAEDEISWPGTVTTPAPKPTAKKKPVAKKPAATKSASAN
jgi:hypothetical protein